MVSYQFVNYHDNCWTKSFLSYFLLIDIHRDSMGHEWVKNTNRISQEYVEGIKDFINVAKRNLDSRGLTLCPCN